MKKINQTKLKTLLTIMLVAVLTLSDLCPVINKVGVLTAYADEEELSEEEKARQELLEKTYKIEVASNKIKGWPKGPGTYGEAACVMDMETGTVLYDKKMNTKQYPASITKIMTAYVTIKYGDLNSKVEFVQDDISFLEPGDASIGMHAGEIITMKDAMYAMLLHSANEVSHAIIRTVGGQVREKGEIEVPGAPTEGGSKASLDYRWGIALMNMEAKAIGCTGSHFVNSYGLHDKEHYVTAHDMCLIGAAAYQYEYFRKVTQTLSYTIPKYKKYKRDKKTKKKYKTGLYTVDARGFSQYHKMLYPEHEYYYKYATSGKTGFTDQAGTTLVTMAEKNGRKLVCTCLHTYGAANVYSDTRALLEYGFKNFEHLTLSAEDIAKIANSKEEGSGGESRIKGIGRKITMIDEDEIVMAVPKGTTTDKISGTVVYNMADFDLNAGLLQFTYHDTPVGELGVHFESFEASVKRALRQAHEKRFGLSD